MTFEDLVKRVLLRWWLTLIFILGFTLIFYSWTSSTSYQASLGIGISFNNPDFLGQNDGQVQTNSVGKRGSEYTLALEEFSRYLAARFNSAEVQSMVAQRAGLKISSFSTKQAFYTVTPQFSGYISIAHELPSQESAEAFIQAIKSTFKDLITIEKNLGELQPYKIKPKEEFVETVTPVSKKAQFKILPSVVGFLVGITLSALLPFKKF